MLNIIRDTELKLLHSQTDCLSTSNLYFMWLKHFHINSCLFKPHGLNWPVCKKYINKFVQQRLVQTSVPNYNYIRTQRTDKGIKLLQPCGQCFLTSVPRNVVKGSTRNHAENKNFKIPRKIPNIPRIAAVVFGAGGNSGVMSVHYEAPLCFIFVRWPVVGLPPWKKVWDTLN